MDDKSLYERLGGVFAIAALVDNFSDAVVKNPKVGQRSPNSALDEWSTQELDRLPGADDACPACAEVARRPFPIQSAPPVPMPGCTNEICRCDHIPVIP